MYKFNIIQISSKNILELKSKVDPLIGLIVSYMYHDIFNLEICFEYDVMSGIVFFIIVDLRMSLSY